MLKWHADSWDYLWLVKLYLHFCILHATVCIADARALTSGFTNGIGQIWLDDVQCVGNESRLIDCPARPLGVHGCSHFDDAKVSCPPIGMHSVCSLLLLQVQMLVCQYNMQLPVHMTSCIIHEITRHLKGGIQITSLNCHFNLP